MDLNYVLLPEDYIPSPLPADTTNDDKMEVDEVPVGEPMEVDDVVVRPARQIHPLPKRRVINVTAYLVSPPRPMEVDPAPTPAWPVQPRPAWYVDETDFAPANPWPVIPRPAWHVNADDIAKMSAALKVGGSRVSRKSPRKASPQKSTTTQQSASPPRPQVDKPAVSHHPGIDMSKVATSSKVKLEDMPVLSANSSDSLNVVQHVESKEPVAHPIRKTRFATPLSPVKQSKIDNDLFFTSNRQSPDLIRNDRWLRTPGRNIDNESVFEDCEGVDCSQLAVAHPPTHGADTSFPEVKRFSPVRRVRMDEDFFLTSGRKTPDLAVGDRWLKISRTPDHNIYNESSTSGDEEDNCPSLTMAYPSSEATEESQSLPEIDFAEADTSLTWDAKDLTPSTPLRIRRTKVFSPLSPALQSKLDDDVFISHGPTPDLISNNDWLKTSRTPGRNIDNESAFLDDEEADYSYLARAYPFIEDSDTSLDEDNTKPVMSTATSFVSGTSGYLADESFDMSLPSSSSLVSDDSFGYMADVSCCSFVEVPEISDVSQPSIEDDEMFQHSSETASEARSEIDLSSSASMDLLIATMSNLVIDDLEEDIGNDESKTASEVSDSWHTVEETAPRDDTGDATSEVFERVREEEEATESDNEESTDNSGFDSYYPSSLSSGNEGSCSCSLYAYSNDGNLSTVNVNVSTDSAAPGTRTGTQEDVGSSTVEEFRWEYDEPEEEAHEGGEDREDQACNDNPVQAEQATGTSVNGQDLYGAGNETELDVSSLDDDLKYIYTLSY